MPYTPNNNPYIPGDPYSYDLKWMVEHIKNVDAKLVQLLDNYGVPEVVSTAAEMTDPNKLYIYVGSEPGYTNGDWYYYDESTQLWTSGGAFGGIPVDAALDINSTNPVENKAVTSAINSANSDITQLQSDMSDAAGDISQLQSDFGTLKTEVSRFRKVICIGDSYGTGSGGGLSVTPWPERLAGRFGLSYGTDLRNYSYGGRSFGGNNGEESNPDTGTNFCDGLRKAINSLTASQRTAITDIIVGGGINDWSKSSSVIWTGMSNFKSMADDYFPNARIHVCLIGNALVPQYRVPYIQDILNYYHAYGTRAGFTVYDCYKKLICNKSMMHTDGVHPTDTAQTSITDEIYNSLTGGSLPPQYKRSSFTSTIGNGIAWFDGSNIHIKFTSSQVTLDTSIAIGTSWADVGTIQSDLLNGGSGTYGVDPFTLWMGLRDNSTWYNNIGIQIRFMHDSDDFDNVKIQARNTSFRESGATLKSFTSIDRVWPLDYEITLNPAVN